MNRRRILSGIRRDLNRQGVNAAAWFAGQSFHASTDVPLTRLSIPELDRIGPKLVTTLPQERAVCIYCTGAPASDANFPYCSSQCAINAEHS